MRSVAGFLLVVACSLAFMGCGSSGGGDHGGSGALLSPSGGVSWAASPEQRGFLNHPVNRILQISTGQSPFNFSVVAGSLPPGVSFTVDQFNFTLVGSPTANGTSNFTVRVVDAYGQVADLPVTFQVTDPFVFGIVNAPAQDVMPSPILGAPYSAQLTVTGGAPPHSDWRIAQGSLPSGLSLDPNTGQVTGTATQSGTFNFRVSVDDTGIAGDNIGVSQSFTITCQ